MRSPCSKESGPQIKVSRKVQISELDLRNLSECFRKVLEILFTKITSIGIRYAYFATLGSVMVFVTIFSKTIGNPGKSIGNHV